MNAAFAGFSEHEHIVLEDETTYIPVQWAGFLSIVDETKSRGVPALIYKFRVEAAYASERFMRAAHEAIRPSVVSAQVGPMISAAQDS